MDENKEFKRIIAQKSGGIEDKMILMPYAKDIVYSDGLLGLTLELFGEDTETEINIRLEVSDELKAILDKALV